jgi:hypothetical protein
MFLLAVTAERGRGSDPIVALEPDDPVDAELRLLPGFSCRW